MYCSHCSISMLCGNMIQFTRSPREMVPMTLALHHPQVPHAMLGHQAHSVRHKVNRRDHHDVARHYQGHAGVR